MPGDEWVRVEEIELLIGERGDAEGAELGFIGLVEAKGVSRRVVVAIIDEPGNPTEVIARWRDGVPASVRVLGRRLSAHHRQTIERQLIAYARRLRGARIDETQPKTATFAFEPESS